LANEEALTLAASADLARVTDAGSMRLPPDWNPKAGGGTPKGLKTREKLPTLLLVVARERREGRPDDFKDVPTRVAGSQGLMKIARHGQCPFFT